LLQATGRSIEGEGRGGASLLVQVPWKPSWVQHSAWVDSPDAARVGPNTSMKLAVWAGVIVIPSYPLGVKLGSLNGPM
jgi:hypothetical protein